MKILMLTNVYTPQIGGVTRSVELFSNEMRQQGHQVKIVAPEYERMPPGEKDVIRVAAIPKFYQNQYPLPVPVVSALLPHIHEFAPDIVHVHHPFLLGSTGQAIAAECHVPLVYTHHTRYSVYIETKTNWPRPIEEGIVEMILGFCELTNGIIAPSQGIADLLKEHGVTTEIVVIPTGVDLKKFSKGNGSKIRKQEGIPEDAFVVGHVGRLAVEKNCRFLVRSIREFLKQRPDAHIVVVGDGPERAALEETLNEGTTSGQVHFLGFREGQDLIDCYHSFDLFAFASHSETQGMVLAEAMAAGSAVLAVHGTGVSDIIVDGENGRIIEKDDEQAYVAALNELYEEFKANGKLMPEGVRKTAEHYSQTQCATKVLNLYERLIAEQRTARNDEWELMQQRWEAGWNRWRNRARAVAAAARETFTLQPAGDVRNQDTLYSGP